MWHTFLRHTVDVLCLQDMRLSSEFNFADPPLLFECNRVCTCTMTCFNRVAQLGIR